MFLTHVTHVVTVVYMSKMGICLLYIYEEFRCKSLSLPFEIFS